MLGKVKKWLGIEGVKLELILPEAFAGHAEEITGIVRFRSMHEQTVQKIKIFMIERYARGRRKNKTIDEYKMGEMEMDVNVSVMPDEEVDIPFTIQFEQVKSEMDELEDKNFILKGIVRAAKYMKGAKSSFWIEAEADVKGVALNPFDKKEIEKD